MPTRLSMLYEKQKELYFLSHYVQKTRVMKIFINFYTRIVKYIFTRQFFFEMPTRLTILTEPRKALQPKSTQWFPRIILFVVQAISLGPCKRPIEFLTSSHPCCRFSKIPNFQIHKIEKCILLSNFWQRDFLVISYAHKDSFWSDLAKQNLRHMFRAAQNWSVYLKKSKFWSQKWNTKESMGKIKQFHSCQNFKILFF